MLAYRYYNSFDKQSVNSYCTWEDCCFRPQHRLWSISYKLWDFRSERKRRASINFRTLAVGLYSSSYIFITDAIRKHTAASVWTNHFREANYQPHCLHTSGGTASMRGICIRRAWDYQSRRQSPILMRMLLPTRMVNFYRVLIGSRLCASWTWYCLIVRWSDINRIWQRLLMLVFSVGFTTYLALR